VAFQARYDFDFVKVSPASSFCLVGWGAEDTWQGTLEGTRDYTRHPISAPSDWRALQVQNPESHGLGAQLECLHLIRDSLDPGVPFIQTVFSPLAQVKNLVGEERLPICLRAYPDDLRAGLETITETTLRFVRAARECGIAGIFYAVQQAQLSVLTEEEYMSFGRPYDLRILQEASELWLNVLHIHGTDIMFNVLADYPVQVVNWHDQETSPTLAEAKRHFSGAVCGGLARWNQLVRGTPDAIVARAREAVQETKGRRFILGTGCVTPVIAPTSNIWATRTALED